MTPEFPYTKNNHFKWGWGNDWWGSYSDYQPYNIQLGVVSRPPESFRSECVRTVCDIANSASKPILLGLSGGSDSQVAALSLLEAKIPFTALIVRYCKPGHAVLNQHDIATAYEFCKKFNVEFQELDIDIDQYYRDRGPELAKKYNMAKLETLIQTGVMDLVCGNYCYIMAGGDVMFVPPAAKISAQYDIPLLNNLTGEPCWWESPVPIMQYMIDQGYEGTSKFYMYSPELIASYLGHPVMQMFLNNADIIYSSYVDLEPASSRWWRCFHWMYKPLMTRSEFPELLPTKKYTGFENLYASQTATSKMSIYDEILNNATRGVYRDEKILITVKDLLKYVTRDHSDSDRRLVAR